VKTAPPLYEQVRRGTGRNRVLAWLAAHSYRTAALRGARFGAMIGLAVGLVRLIPGLSPERTFSFVSLVGGLIVSSCVGTLLAMLATAVARGVIRFYARVRLGSGPA
jgi:hypothetical protein